MSETFESALEKLQKTVEKLQLDSLGLDETITTFEQGVEHLAQCQTFLARAEGKILELKQGKNGKLVEELLGDSLSDFLGETDGK